MLGACLGSSSRIFAQCGTAACLLTDTSSKLALLAFMATWLLCMLSMPCLMLCKQDSHCSPPPLALKLQLDCEERLR